MRAAIFFLWKKSGNFAGGKNELYGYINVSCLEIVELDRGRRMRRGGSMIMTRGNAAIPAWWKKGVQSVPRVRCSLAGSRQYHGSTAVYVRSPQQTPTYCLLRGRSLVRLLVKCVHIFYNILFNKLMNYYSIWYY